MKNLIVTTALFVCSLAGCASWGSFGCPSMNTAGIDLLDCPEGQVKVCETTEEGRCCTCDTPKTTAPASEPDEF